MLQSEGHAYHNMISWREDLVNGRYHTAGLLASSSTSKNSRGFGSPRGQTSYMQEKGRGKKRIMHVEPKPRETRHEIQGQAANAL